jgi:hypothetical protein
MNPVVLICGNAGAGKDVVANELARVTNGYALALATPIKDFAEKVFGFSRGRLFGPSAARNEPDPRFDIKGEVGLMTWADVYEAMDTWANDFAQDHLTHLSPERFSAAALAMAAWFGNLMHEHGLTLKKSEGGCGMIIHDLNAPVLTPRRVLQTFGTEFGRAVETGLWTDIALKRCADILMVHDLAIISDGRFRSEILAVKAAGGKVIKVIDPAATSTINDHASETELDTVPTSWFDVILVNDKAGGLAEVKRLVLNELVFLVCPGPRAVPCWPGL